MRIAAKERRLKVHKEDWRSEMRIAAKGRGSKGFTKKKRLEEGGGPVPSAEQSGGRDTLFPALLLLPLIMSPLSPLILSTSLTTISPPPQSPP